MYDHSFENYEALKKHLETQRSQVRQLYSDFGKAVFGYRIYDPDSGFDIDPPTPGSPPEAFAAFKEKRAAALPKSNLCVWMKFGRELSSSTVVKESLQELLDYLEANKEKELYKVRDDSSMFVVDYSAAGSGSSLIFALSPEAFQASSMANRRKFDSVPWPYVLGFERRPMPPFVPRPRPV